MVLVVNNRQYPLVSIVIPFYNRVDLVTRALDSVYLQTYINYEVILVNDGSDSDDTVLREYIVNKSRLRYYILEQNMGPSYARNCGLALARGEYVAFLDSDDYWHPEKLMLQVTLMMRTNARICGSRHKVTNPYEELVELCAIRYTDEIIPYSIVKWSTTLFRSPFATPSVILHRDVFSQYQFDVKYRYAEDYEYWLRILYDYPGVRVDIPLIYTFKHDYLGDGDSLSVDMMKMQRSQNKCFIDWVKSSDLRMSVRILLVVALLFSQVKYFKRRLYGYVYRRFELND